MRLFYAVTVPQEVAAQLGEMQRTLRGNWRAVRPDQLHITLAYLPSVQDQDLSHLREVGRDIVQGVQPFTVRLRGTGYFPNEGSPRVWFVKAEAPELDLMAARLRETLRVPFDDKGFKAHVTLARKKGPAPRVAPQVLDLSWDVRRVRLIKSTLHKTGPEYEVISTFTLRAAHAASDTPQEAQHG